MYELVFVKYLWTPLYHILFTLSADCMVISVWVPCQVTVMYCGKKNLHRLSQFRALKVTCVLKIMQELRNCVFSFLPYTVVKKTPVNVLLG
jgi:hypothetical protein